MSSKTGSNNQNAKKAKQLGMSGGAATHKLRKSVLFYYVKLADAHFCFRCGVEIENVDDFTLDHKEPWLGESNELFWDIKNIAFSHSLCNSMAGRKPPKIDTTLPCKNGHIGEFSTRIDGSTRCKACRREEYKTRTSKENT